MSDLHDGRHCVDAVRSIVCTGIIFSAFVSLESLLSTESQVFIYYLLQCLSQMWYQTSHLQTSHRDLLSLTIPAKLKKSCETRGPGSTATFLFSFVPAGVNKSLWIKASVKWINVNVNVLPVEETLGKQEDNDVCVPLPVCKCVFVFFRIEKTNVKR